VPETSASNGAWPPWPASRWPKTRPFKKELEQLDKRLPQLQAERTRLEGLLSQPISPAEMAEAGRSLKTCNDEIDSLEERWLELSEQIEQLSAAISD
jgi:ATP-binding cassette subfamily F protein 3